MDSTMTIRRAASWVAGGTLLAAWLAAAAAPSFGPDAPAPREDLAPLDPSPQVLELVDETERLQQRLATTAERGPVTRNPFEFASAASRARAAEGPAVLEAPAPAVGPAQPALRLIGVAEDMPGAADPRRTAIIAGGGDVVLARIGDVVDGRYRVARIGDDAVDLEDISASGESAAVHLTLP